MEGALVRGLEDNPSQGPELPFSLQALAGFLRKGKKARPASALLQDWKAGVQTSCPAAIFLCIVQGSEAEGKGVRAQIHFRFLQKNKL